jgi:Leucine-rich repeat (LRR) protein
LRTKQIIALLFLVIVLPAPAQEPSLETNTVTIKWAGHGSGVIYRNGENVGKTPVSVELKQGDLITGNFFLSYVYVNGTDLTFSFDSEKNVSFVNDRPYGILIESPETPVPAKIQDRPVRTIVFHHSVSPSESQLNKLSTRSSIHVLTLKHTDITDDELSHLSALDTLRTLELRNTDITDDGLSFLSNLSNLRHLDLADTNITDAGLSHLSDLTALRTLNLQNTTVTDNGLSHLSNLTSLQELNLSGTNITGKGLTHLSSMKALRELQLSDTEIINDHLKHLSKLSALRSIHLDRTKVTGDGLAHLSNLRTLNLNHTSVTNAGLSRISNMPSLETLLLSGTNISDPALSHLADLTSLRTLHLSKTDITDDGLSSLSHLISLRNLDLKKTEISDSGLTYLTKLTSLRKLDLRFTQVTYDGLLKLSNLTSLQRLRFYGAKIYADRTKQIRKRLRSMNFQYAYYLFEVPEDFTRGSDREIPLFITEKPLEKAPVKVYAFKTFERDLIYYAYPDGRKIPGKSTFARIPIKMLEISGDQLSENDRKIQFQGKTYRYQRIPNEEVVHLLKNPKGTIGIVKPLDAFRITKTNKVILKKLISDLKRETKK